MDEIIKKLMASGVSADMIEKLKGCQPVVEAPKDRDGDGIPDENDACPDQPGPAKFLGCPDRDGDNIPDYLDPDSDNDGDPDEDENNNGTDPYDSDSHLPLPAWPLAIVLILLGIHMLRSPRGKQRA